VENIVPSFLGVADPPETGFWWLVRDVIIIAALHVCHQIGPCATVKSPCTGIFEYR
jgi:hypothetical protein